MKMEDIHRNEVLGDSEDEISVQSDNRSENDDDDDEEV